MTWQCQLPALRQRKRTMKSTWRSCARSAVLLGVAQAHLHRLAVLVRAGVAVPADRVGRVDRAKFVLDDETDRVGLTARRVRDTAANEEHAAESAAKADCPTCSPGRVRCAAVIARRAHPLRARRHGTGPRRRSATAVGPGFGRSTRSCRLSGSGPTVAHVELMWNWNVRRRCRTDAGEQTDVVALIRAADDHHDQIRVVFAAGLAVEELVHDRAVAQQDCVLDGARLQLLAPAVLEPGREVERRRHGRHCRHAASEANEDERGARNASRRAAGRAVDPRRAWTASG